MKPKLTDIEITHLAIELAERFRIIDPSTDSVARLATIQDVIFRATMTAETPSVDWNTMKVPPLS